MLLGAEMVRTELKIEDAQAATIDAALAAYREERSSAPRPDREAFQAMTEEERTAFMEKSQKEREELSKKTDEVLNALLEPDQAKRLDQIALQLKLSAATVATLKSDDLKSKLSLSDEQVAKLDEAEKAAAADMMKMFEEMRAAGGGQGGQPGGGGGNPGGPGGGFAAMQEKMTAARAKSTEAAMAVLTDEQKKMIEELKGAKFELDMRALFGGGRGGDGGGRQRGTNGGKDGGGKGTRPPAE
jgi:Spy/CpxP family protein refolding chaperone